MLDRDIRFEALSAVLGLPVRPLDVLPGKTTGQQISADDFNIAAILGNKFIIKQLCPALGLVHDDSDTFITKVYDRISALEHEFFIDESEFFDPPYDYDFTGLSTSESYERGGEPYERPYGWYRMALKVKDKYPDGNTWLGPNGWRRASAPGEWPVSYHGTSLDGAKGIISSNYKAGSGAVYGRGIYSTPKLSVASDYYSKTFQSKKNGKTYRIVMQNRINPKERVKCNYDQFWLIPVATGTSDKEERKIVERSIRPYGILIQEHK